MYNDFDERWRLRFADRFCYIGGGSKTETTSQQQTQQNTIDPDQKALLLGNYAQAQGNTAKLSQAYGGPLTAGFSPLQTQAQGVLSGIATDPQYQNTNSSIAGGVNGILSHPVSASPVGASTIAGSDLSPYMNPFQKNVIDASVAQNERARQIAGVQNNQLSTQANAFGGARAGVADSLTNEAYDRNNQQNLAALNSANFTQAQGAAATDAATRNQVGEFNSGQNVNTQQFNTNTGLTGAGVLSGLNNNGLALATQQGGILGAVGDAQQAQAQTEATNNYQAYLQWLQQIMSGQNLSNAALGLMPTQQTISSTGNGTQVTKSNPGLGGIFGGLLGAGETAGNLGWSPFGK